MRDPSLRDLDATNHAKEVTTPHSLQFETLRTVTYERRRERQPVSLIAIYATVAWSAIIVFVVWRLISTGGADDPDRTDAVTGHSVDYWVA